jgi:hypothetical protein
LNCDGKQDLAATNQWDDSVSVLLGSGSGMFATKVDYGTGSCPNSVAVGDFDGDGMLDIATANNYGDSVSVLLNATSR